MSDKVNVVGPDAPATCSWCGAPWDRRHQENWRCPVPAAQKQERFARLTCECGWSQDLELGLDRLMRDPHVGEAWRAHQHTCPVQVPIIKEAKELVLRLERELLPRLGWRDPIVGPGLADILELGPEDRTDRNYAA